MSCHDVDVAYRQRGVEECGVARCADGECAAVAVDDGGVLLFVHFSVPYGELALTAFVEVYVLEAYEAALESAQSFGRLRKLGEGVYHERVDGGGTRVAVEFCVDIECFGSHERYLPRLSVLVPRLASYLLESGVFADFHSCYVHDDLLSAAVAEVEVVAVDGECQGGSLVLYDDALEDIAFLVGGYYGAADDEPARRVVLVGDGVGVVGIVAPELLFELKDGGVGLQCRHRRFCRGIVDIVLAGGEACGDNSGDSQGADI